ncbi:hypothetical protein BGZ80_005763, partial [Entomortierella chlamydospora]
MGQRNEKKQHSTTAAGQGSRSLGRRNKGKDRDDGIFDLAGDSLTQRGTVSQEEATPEFGDEFPLLDEIEDYLSQSPDKEKKPEGSRVLVPDSEDEAVQSRSKSTKRHPGPYLPILMS